MENRKKLHDFGLVLILLGIVNLFMFVGTIVDSLLDGTVQKTLATVDPNILGAVKGVLIVIAGLSAILVVADVIIGIKALNVSKNPDASKGYITAAKVFLIMSSIAIISNAVTIFGGTASIIDSSLNVANATLSVCIYFWFISAAEAVRKDFLNGEKK